MLFHGEIWKCKFFQKLFRYKLPNFNKHITISLFYTEWREKIKTTLFSYKIITSNRLNLIKSLAVIESDNCIFAQLDGSHKNTQGGRVSRLCACAYT